MAENEGFTFPGSEITEHALLSTLLKSAQIKYFWKDTERRFVGASQSFLDYYDFDSVDRILGKTDEDMGWHVDPIPYKNDEYQVIHRGEAVYFKPGTCIVRGQMHNIRATKLPILNNEGKVVGLAGFFEDVTEHLKETERLQEIANTDALTGLLNRNGYNSIIEKYVAAYETQGTDFVALYLDMDNFKTANDTYGHAFGDEVLKAVADALRKGLGSNSVIARMGGNEFIVLRQLSDTNGPASIDRSVLSMRDQIRSAVSGVRYIGGHSFRLDISIGIAAYSETRDAAKLLEEADLNMFEEKRSKRG